MICLEVLQKSYLPFRLDLLNTPVIFENALLAKCSTLPSTF